MRGFGQWRLAFGLVLFGIAAGCRSLPSPSPLLDGGLVSSPEALPLDQAKAAQAYAFYSIGIHHELADEYDLAYEAYRQAAELDSGNERLVLRMLPPSFSSARPRRPCAPSRISSGAIRIPKAPCSGSPPFMEARAIGTASSISSAR